LAVAARQQLRKIGHTITVLLPQVLNNSDFPEAFSNPTSLLCRRVTVGYNLFGSEFGSKLDGWPSGLKALVLKTKVPATASWVGIPPHRKPAGESDRSVATRTGNFRLSESRHALARGAASGHAGGADAPRGGTFTRDARRAAGWATRPVPDVRPSA